MGKVSQVIKTAADIHERGIALKVLNQNIDTSTAERRLFFHMTAAFDEFQRELMSKVPALVLPQPTSVGDVAVDQKP